MSGNYTFRYEISSVDSNFPARVLLFDKPGKMCYIDKHWHNTIEINYVIRGDFNLSLPEGDFTLSNNDFYIINSNEVHQTVGKYDDEHVKYLVIIFSHTFLKHYLPDYNKYNFLVDSDEKRDYLRKILAKISSYMTPDKENAQLHVLCGLMKILEYMVEECAVELDKSQVVELENTTDYAKIAVEFIRKHFSEELPLERVADVVGLTPTYFARMFKKKTSKTFLTYLNEVRMSEALREMDSYGITETEAALRAGFPNVKAFIQTFKKHYNCTPRDYYRQNKAYPSGYGFEDMIDGNNYT